MIVFKFYYFVDKYRYPLFITYILFFLILIWCVCEKTRNGSSDYDDDAEVVKLWEQHILDEPCHRSRADDALPILSNNETMPANSIFFHDTSCKGGLTTRQTCVVESAAKAHPERQINVFFTSSVSEDSLKNGSLNILTKYYDNVKMRRVLIVDYANGTPIASAVRNMRSDLMNIHISKIMKYLTLYKYSGIYLSLDAIVAQNLDLWENWVVKDTPSTLSSDMFGFSGNKVGRTLAESALGFLGGELSISKVHDFWSYSGPSVISHLLDTWCTTDKVEQMSMTTCKDLAVYSPELFYPISFYDRKAYYNVVDWSAWQNKDIYTYFIWEHFTKFNIISPVSLYGRIASEYCPVTYKRYDEKFGLWYTL